LKNKPLASTKSLVHILQDHVANESYRCWECRSAPYDHHTALYPIVNLLQRLLHWHQRPSPEAKLATLGQFLCQYRLPVKESDHLPNCVRLTAVGLGYFSSDFWYSPITLMYWGITQPVAALTFTSSRGSCSTLKIVG
jgi:hypothetical protein